MAFPARQCSLEQFGSREIVIGLLGDKTGDIGPRGAVRRMGFGETDFPAGFLVLRILTLLVISIDT